MKRSPHQQGHGQEQSCAKQLSCQAHSALQQQVHCRQTEEAEVDILAGAGALLGRAKQLPSGMIETTRLRDANQQEPSSGVVQSVEFHPAGRLLLTAGLDKRLRLFQVRCLPFPRQHDTKARPVSLVFSSLALLTSGCQPAGCSHQ